MTRKRKDMTKKELKKINSRIEELIALYVHYKWSDNGLCLPAYESKKAKQKYCRKNKSRDCDMCRVAYLENYIKRVRKDYYFKLSDFKDEEESE